jgi:serine/threonine protein kinase
MANESNASKRATIKPPAAAPRHLDQLAGKTPIDSADAKGKVVRTVPPAAGATQPGAQEPVDTEPAGSTGGAPAGARKAVTMLDGDYKLLKKLGKGGMGTVYKAHQISLDRIVAVKVLAKELASKDAYVRRFQREARMMIKLDHANILRCFGVGKDKETGCHYLSMELVEGGSVESWRKKLGRFSIGDALHIILKSAAGLQHAHNKNMIHRDIKPENILLTGEGVVKVADLGLAKDTQENLSLTRTGGGAGTPLYMAPEQARDFKHVDIRVDIYALGVMLYVFLTGLPPFRSDNLVDLVSAKEKGNFDPMRRHNDEVPSKLDLIVDKMIAKDPNSRYASCQDLINDLEPLGLANEQLSFIELEVRAAPADINPATEIIETDLLEPPAKVWAKTCVGAAGKTPAAKTSAPTPAATTSAPAPAAKISIVKEATAKGDWFWSLVTPDGRPVTKKLTTEQIRTLIKSGHLDPTAQLSKTAKSGFRAAATFPEFQGIFLSLKTATKANVKGAKYRDRYKEIEEEDARRRKWGWLSRLFKSAGSTLFGLVWIALILGLVGLAIFGVYKYMN